MGGLDLPRVWRTPRLGGRLNLKSCYGAEKDFHARVQVRSCSAGGGTRDITRADALDLERREEVLYRRIILDVARLANRTEDALVGEAAGTLRSLIACRNRSDAAPISGDPADGSISAPRKRYRYLSFPGTNLGHSRAETPYHLISPRIPG